MTTGRERLETLEKDVQTEARNAPLLTSALIDLARHEMSYASDQGMKKRADRVDEKFPPREDIDYWRGYYQACKKLLRRLNKDTE